MSDTGRTAASTRDVERRQRLLERILRDRSLLGGALDLITDTVVVALGVPIAIVSLVGPERQHFVGQTGLPSEVAAGTPISHSFCQHVVSRNDVLVIEDSAREPLVWDNPAVEELGVGAYAGQPIVVHGQVIGSMCAIDHVPRVWSEREVEALRAFAEIVQYLIEVRLATEGKLLDEQATSRARDQQQTARLAVYEALTSEQTTVEELNRRLQRALLPASSSPPVARAEVFYRPGSDRLLLGGDFVDTMLADDGALSFVIGDVTGHGPEAAALAISLRASWHALQQVGTDLLATVRVLDGQTSDTDLFATLLLGRLDQLGHLSLVSAGHPAPITVSGSTVAELPAVPGSMLGLGLGASRWVVTEHELQEGTLLAYTDGLIEGRVGDTRERFGIDRLLDAIRRLGPEPVALCEAATEANGAGLPDDVAILTISPA